MADLQESDMDPVGRVLTFFGPGCWMWQTTNEDGEVVREGVAGSREQAIRDSEAAVRRV